MGRLQHLHCPKCDNVHATKTVFRCLACGEVLEVVVDLSHLTAADIAALRNSRDRSIWRWFDFFPVAERSSIVSLGEGSTPLIRAQRLGKRIGIANLYLKNDTVLPTGSLKDRSNSVGISMAKELGFEKVAVMSTGNAAASVAAYAAAAGLPSVVMVPAGTAVSKIIQAHAYGAQVIVIDGSFDKEVALLYQAAVREFGWYDCLSSNPYRVGKKSYAYELVDDLDGEVPDWIIHPTAGGTGIVAMWQGFKDFQSLGWINKTPKLVAAQSAAAAPLVMAFEQARREFTPVDARETIAESIQVGNPAALGRRMLAALYESDGAAVALTDAEALDAQRLTASLAGVFAEPAGAISVAAAFNLRRAGLIGKEDRVVCNITGHGLKQPESIAIAADSFKPIAPTLSALERALAGNCG